jgi:tight adherence protein B
MVRIMLVVACALGIGAGLAGFVTALAGRPVKSEGSPGQERGHGRLGTSRRVTSLALSRRLALAMAAGLLVGLLTGWPVAGLLGFGAVYGLPHLMGKTAWGSATRRIEGVAAWTELLRDTLASSAGLSQAIVASAAVAPTSVREPVRRLAARVGAGVPMEEALRRFGDDLDDETADLVVCALLLASQARAQRIGELLGELASSAREQVAMRLKIEASRASTRSGVRTVVVFSLAFACLLAVFAHSYLAPFGTPVGQVVLAGVGAAYALGLVLMVRMAAPPPPFRLVSSAPRGGAEGTPLRRSI